MKIKCFLADGVLKYSNEIKVGFNVLLVFHISVISFVWCYNRLVI